MIFRRKRDDALPAHIGIIMDGNGRWAKLRGLSRQAGHKVGAETFRNIVRHCNHRGIAYLTVYAFSTENWKRPPEEVAAIIELLREFLIDAPNFSSDNVQLQFIGDLTTFDDDLLAKIADCEQQSASFTGLHLNIAINYGGRLELTQAVSAMGRQLLAGTLALEEISEQTISDHLYTKGQPDVDLIIRPSGEYRLSNFMIWQAAYAEYVFMDHILWPEFTPKHLDQALKEYARRHRRFGGV